MTTAVERIGVVGAGTMGAGIAQLACLAGYESVLQYPLPEALEEGSERVVSGLAKGAGRGMWTAAEADEAGQRLASVPSIHELSGCDLVIEAAPEDLGLKQRLFADLAANLGGPDTILA